MCLSIEYRTHIKSDTVRFICDLITLMEGYEVQTGESSEIYQPDSLVYAAVHTKETN